MKQKRYYVALALIVAILSIIVVSAIWFGHNQAKVTIDQEYYNEDTNFLELDNHLYDDLISQQNSFLIFVDQGGCTTADRMRDFVRQYSSENKLRFYRMMWSDLRQSSLHETVKFYPSIVIVSGGHIIDSLKADDDRYVSIYNNYDEFKNWLDNFIQK